jgi:hypothetical protein
MDRRNPNELPDPTNGCEVCATHGLKCHECKAEETDTETLPEFE